MLICVKNFIKLMLQDLQNLRYVVWELQYNDPTRSAADNTFMRDWILKLY